MNYSAAIYVMSAAYSDMNKLWKNIGKDNRERYVLFLVVFCSYFNY